MATKTIQIADKPTLDAIKTIVNALNSNAADKTTLDAIQTLLQNSTYGLSTIKASIDSISDGSSSYSSFKAYSMSRSDWRWNQTGVNSGPYGSTIEVGYWTRTLNTKISITGKGRFIVNYINTTDFNGFYVTIDGTRIALPGWLQTSGDKIDFGKSLVFECSSKEDDSNFNGITRYPKSGTMSTGIDIRLKPAATAFTGYLQM